MKRELMAGMLIMAFLLTGCSYQKESEYTSQPFEAQSVDNENISEGDFNLAETENLQEETLDDTAADSDAADEQESSLLEEYLEEYSVYNNPIDEYFLPKIYNWDSDQATIRAAQDAYRVVWEDEFKNLIKWLMKKCVYNKDKKNIKALKKIDYSEVETP